MSTTDTARQPGKNLGKLLAKLAAADKPAAAGHPAPTPASTPEDPRPDPMLDQLVYSMCLWESSTDAANELAARIHAAFVDLNELRVAFVDEVVAALNDGSPCAAERAARLQSALTEIYERHHTLTLADLSTIGKREAKAYLESIDALPQSVAARLLLLCCDVPAMPMDERLRAALAAERAIDPSVTIEAAAHLLEKTVPHEQLATTYLQLHAWCDAKSGKPAGRAAKVTSAKPTSAKPASAKAGAAKPRAAKPAKERTPRAAKTGDRPARSRPKTSG